VGVIAVSGSVWFSRPHAAGEAVATPPAEPVRTVEPHPLLGSTTLGSEAAKVAIIEYGDFECSYCGQVARETWPALKTRYVDTGKVLASFRHFPLSRHRHARAAAVHAICAAQQGRFWEAHGLLYEPNRALGDLSGAKFVTQLQLNSSAFDACSRKGGDIVAADLALAATMGVSSTPTYFIGRREKDTVKVARVFVGAEPLETFTAVLDELLTSGDARQDP
jgi:protein-disulfide isomerase